MTWLEEIIDTLKELGGVAHLSDIFEYIEMHTSKELYPTWKLTVRSEIYRHSSDSISYVPSNRDLFYSAEGIGKGVWGLREMLVKTPVAEDIGKIVDKTQTPKKVKTEIYRVLRDTTLTKKMKLLYKNRCQICGTVIKLKDDKGYSEAHHIKPLGKHNGPDSADNIIILCPNHHVEFDYGVIAIDPDKLTIIHKDPNNPYLGKKIYLHPSHRLNKEYLKYHLDVIYNSSEGE